MCDACDLILLNLSCVLRYVAKDKRIFRNVLEYIYLALQQYTTKIIVLCFSDVLHYTVMPVVIMSVVASSLL